VGWTVSHPLSRDRRGSELIDSPKWLPFCSCGLVTGAYAFLLLALAVQADNDFATPEELVERSEEVEALLTNVKVILAGLEAYGVMWAGIEVMAGIFFCYSLPLPTALS